MRFGFDSEPGVTGSRSSLREDFCPGRGDPSWGTSSTASARAGEIRAGAGQALQTSQVCSHFVLLPSAFIYQKLKEMSSSSSLDGCREGGADGLAPLQSLEVATRRQCCLFSDSGCEAGFQIITDNRGKKRQGGQNTQ